MINTIIFFVHIAVLMSATLSSLLLGKEAMVAFICLQSVLANLFVIKQIVLLGLQVTPTDAYIISAMLGLNFLQEFYGKFIARQTIIINFFVLVFYTIACMIQVWYTPAQTDYMHGHFSAILTPVPRIVLASIVSYAISQTVEWSLYGFLKDRMQGKFLVLRNYGSLCTSQLVDTIMFSFLGLYGLVANIWHVILLSYCIKLIVIFLNGPLISAARIIMNSQSNR